MKRFFKIRLIIPVILLLLIWAVQLIPGWGEFYARHLYPFIATPLSFLSSKLPFAVGDLAIFLALCWLIIYPFYARNKLKRRWKNILTNLLIFLMWVYIWFYLAWGLNYSQNSFYQRTSIAYTPYTADNFKSFLDDYIQALNESYVAIEHINADLLRDEIVKGYVAISDSLGIHQPFHSTPKAKTMLFTPLSSMVGVSGSMAPFFSEFTINGNVPISEYSAIYAHELSHLLGITSEAEANFYAYTVCTNSNDADIRFSGYLSLLPHVLNNAYALLTEEEFETLKEKIRPEVIEQFHQNRAQWLSKYNPMVGDIQNWIYNLYLKGNKIQSGTKNYSEVIGLLISHREWLNNKKQK